MQLRAVNVLPKGSRSYYKRTVKSAVIDFFIVIVAYGAVIISWKLADTLDYSINVWQVISIALYLVAMLYIFGIYQRIWERTSGHGITLIIKAVVIATVALVPIILLEHEIPLTLPIVLLANLLSLGGFIAVRYRSRLAISLNWRWRAALWGELPAQEPRTRVLIIGAGESGQTLALRLKHRFNQGNGTHHEVVGFIDDDPEKQNMFVEGCRVVGTRRDIQKLAESLKVDLIVVAVHNIPGQDFREILTSCEQTKAMIKVAPDIQALVNAKHSRALLRDVQAEDLIGRTTVTRHEAVDLTPVMNKVILITGAAGSIGSELSRQIMEYNPRRAILLDNNESGLHDLIIALRAKHPELDLVPVLADITYPASVKAIFEKHRPQIVFHAAAYKHVPMLEFYPTEAIRVNMGGTRNIAMLAQEYRVERFVLISSDKAVNPSNIMGATKRACELLLHALSQSPGNRTRFASVRFGNVLGSRGSVVPTFSQQIESGGPVTVTDEAMTRYFMSIPEAVNLIIHAACLTDGNDIYVLRMGEVVRIVELAERMIRLRGMRPYKDIEIKFTGVRPGEKLHEELFHGDETPIDTIHPNIMQVNTWNEDFNWEEFRGRLERLEQDLPENPHDIFAELLQLITPRSQNAVA